MKPNQITSVIYPVKDLDTAKKLYSIPLGANRTSISHFMGFDWQPRNWPNLMALTKE
jgi:hypothetical protein